jgi:hypothetical protein
VRQAAIVGTLPQAARYSKDSKRFPGHFSSPLLVWSTRRHSAPLGMISHDFSPPVAGGGCALCLPCFSC